MDLVEISPPYDHANITAHLGTRLNADQRAQAEREGERLAGINGQHLPMIGDRHRPT